MSIFIASHYGKINPWRDVSPDCTNGCSNLFVVCWDVGGEGEYYWRCQSCGNLFEGKKR